MKLLKLILYLCLLNLCNCDRSRTKLKEVYKSLNDLIRFFETNTESATNDGVFGFLLAENELLKLAESSCITHGTELTNLLRRIKRFRRTIQQSSSENDSLRSWLKTVNYNDEIFLNDNLPNMNILSFEFFNYTGSNQTESPNESESDLCLLHLLKNRNDCEVTPECMKSMTWNDDSYNYFLTHKLLYFTLMNMKRCTSYLPPGTFVSSIFLNLCSRIYKENLIIQRRNYPLEYHDLYLEQVALCGLNGFNEFLTQSVIDKILTEWRRHSELNCFTDNSLKRKKRSIRLLEGNCSDHMSSLGVTLHAILIRKFCLG